MSAYARGLSRDAWACYLPAYVAIGAACLLASMTVSAVRDIRLRPYQSAA